MWRDSSGTQVDLPSGWGMKSSSLEVGVKTECVGVVLACGGGEPGRGGRFLLVASACSVCWAEGRRQRGQCWRNEQKAGESLF